jgi:MFS family permease
VTIRLGILATVFLAGAALMSLEMASFRLVEPELGSDIVVWGSLISVFLGGLAVGAIIGGRWADVAPNLRKLGIILVAGGMISLAVPFYSDAVLDWAYPGQGAPLPSEWGTGGGDLKLAVYQPPDMRWAALMAGTILFGLPAILLGMVSPYSARLFVHEMPHMGAGIGEVYGVSTVGSIAGTLGTAFYLITKFGTHAILGGNGALLIGLGIALVGCDMARRKAGPTAPQQ